MIVGLTGGIGSGKTTAAQIFKSLGVPLFLADEESKKLIDSDAKLQASLVDLMGSELLTDGKINRPYMASLIFSDAQLLQKVNALIHPAVGDAFKAWYHRQNFSYVIREAAILYESASHQDCDAVIVVSAPEALRLERVKARSGESEEQIRKRMSKQWPAEKKEALADYIIRNDGHEMLIPQVLKIHERLIDIAKKGSG